MIYRVLLGTRPKEILDPSLLHRYVQMDTRVWICYRTREHCNLVGIQVRNAPQLPRSLLASADDSYV